MLCSKCKIFSIHLPNYDSYICENGHVLCRTCNEQMQQCCAICGGCIVRQAQFRLEGVPTAVFKETKGQARNIDKESDHTESLSGSEEWFCRHPREFDPDLEWQPRQSDYDDLNWNLNSNQFPIGDHAFIDFSNGRMHTVGDSNVEPRKDFMGKCKNVNNVKPSKSACKFKGPDPAECCMSFPNIPQQDPKELYEKTLKGEVDFDPKEDYYLRVAQAKQIEEFYRRPNLELARESSSKVELKKELEQSESTTLIEHLKEFREATNYVPPGEIELYTLTTLPDPLILAKAKTNTPSDKDKNSDKFRAEIDKTQLNLRERYETVDVGTMMDLCIEPCLNFMNFSSTEDTHNMMENSEMKFAESKENDRRLELDAREQIGHKRVAKTQQSLRHLLREQLHSEVYSNFDKTKSQQTNNFMTKTSYKPTDFACVSSDPFKELNRNTLLEYINQEIEKALTKLSSPAEVSDAVPVMNKRDELVQRSKNSIREKLLQEIYSNFNKAPSMVGLSHSKSEPSLSQSTPRSNISEDEANLEKPISLALSCACQMSARQCRTIGFSTESYPKLNPDLTILCSPDSQLLEKSPSLRERPLEADCLRCSHSNFEKSISGEIQQPKMSEYSKLNEGPFIQSTVENMFEGSFVNVKSSTPFQQESVIIEAQPNGTESVVNCLKYEDITSTSKLEQRAENYRVEDAVKSAVVEHREELKEKSSSKLTLKDFKDKFPNLSVKQIKDIILNLPNESDELNAENYDSKTNSFSNKVSVQKLSETLDNESTTASVNAVAWRAYYSPISNEDLRSEPSPQYKPISFEVVDDGSSTVDASVGESRPAADLNIPRSPVTCPLTACKKLIFVSEFSKHIKVDHVKIPVESVSPGKCNNLFLDPKVDHHGINKCHSLYLVTDKIRDLGSREYKDFLPILVMSTKVNMMELICPEYRGSRGRQSYLMIWLTGLNPTNMPIYFSLTAWSRCGPIPKCHVVHSGELYSIRNEQDAKTLFRTGQVLLLSQEQCGVLTNDGRNMLELQVVVH